MGLFGKLFGSKQKPSKKGASKKIEVLGTEVIEYDTKGKVVSRTYTPASKQSKSSAPLKSLAQLKREMAAEDAKFNRIMGEVDDAIEALSDSDDRDKAIDNYKAVIEKALANDINLSSSHMFRLVNAYIQAERYDDAWAALNKMLIDRPGDISKIRMAQCRMLKKEKRWLDALQFLMMGHASKYGGFNRDAFLKELKPIANKIPLDESKAAYLADQLEKLKGDSLKLDRKAADVFRAFCKQHLADKA